MLACTSRDEKTEPKEKDIESEQQSRISALVMYVCTLLLFYSSRRSDDGKMPEIITRCVIIGAWLFMRLRIRWGKKSDPIKMYSVTQAFQI